MHPSIFISDLWNGAESPTVFVAMSFAEKNESRYRDVYEPAINCIALDGKTLTAVRVDEHQSGDSIVTDIVRGIAEATIVLADISALAELENGYVARNGNVMYELGIAHAIKSPHYRLQRLPEASRSAGGASLNRQFKKLKYKSQYCPLPLLYIPQQMSTADFIRRKLLTKPLKQALSFFGNEFST